MLPYGVLDGSGKYHFHMAEMAMNPERMKRVPAFYRIIEEHALISISCSINLGDLKRAKERIWVPGLVIDWAFLKSPYIIAFRALMDLFHNNRHLIESLIPLNQKIDFIFDIQAERKIIDEMWNDYVQRRPKHLRDLYGQLPRFEDDKKFLPLQAADLWAWWVRKWTEEGAPEKAEHADFGVWKSKRDDYPKAVMSCTENDVVNYLMSAIREQIGPGRFIYDFQSSKNPLLT